MLPKSWAKQIDKMAPWLSKIDRGFTFVGYLIPIVIVIAAALNYVFLPAYVASLVLGVAAGSAAMCFLATSRLGEVANEIALFHKYLFVLSRQRLVQELLSKLDAVGPIRIDKKSTTERWRIEVGKTGEIVREIKALPEDTRGLQGSWILQEWSSFAEQMNSHPGSESWSQTKRDAFGEALKAADMRQGMRGALLRTLARLNAEANALARELPETGFPFDTPPRV